MNHICPTVVASIRQAKLAKEQKQTEKSKKQSERQTQRTSLRGLVDTKNKFEASGGH